MKKFALISSFVIFSVFIVASALADIISYGPNGMGIQDDFLQLKPNGNSITGVFSAENDPQKKTNFLFSISGTDQRGTVTDISYTDDNPSNKGNKDKNGNAGFKCVGAADEGLVFSANTMTTVLVDFTGNYFSSFGMMLEGHNSKDDYIRVTATTSTGETLELFQSSKKRNPTFFGFSVDGDDYITSLLIEVRDANGNLNNANGGFTMNQVIIPTGSTTIENLPASSTPEPATVLMLGLSVLVGTPIVRRMRKKA